MIPSIGEMADKIATIKKDAQKYLEKGQIDKAIAEWEKLLKEAPDVNIYNTLGDLYLKVGDKKSAVESFLKASQLLRKDGFSMKAIALYKKVLNIEPKNVDSLVALGELNEEKGIITEAIKHYLTATDILSKDTNKERYLSIYGRILSLEPFNIPLREKIAELFLKEGLKSDALREFLYIARLNLDRGEFENAREFFVKAIGIQPENKAACLGMSNLYEQSGDIRQAANYVKNLLDTYPNDVGLLLKHSSLLKKSEAYDDAMSFLFRVLEIKPSDPEACKLMGEIYLIRGERQSAWESYKKVIDSLLKDNQIIDAVNIVNQFRDIDPIETGKLLITLYKRENNIDAVFNETIPLADLLLEQGNKSEAINYYREALKIHTDDIQLKNTIAELELSIVMKPSAIDKEKTTEELLTDADIYTKYGLFDEAMSILNEIRLEDPGNISVHEMLKALYLETGDIEQAVAECLILSELFRRKGDIKKSEMFLKDAFEINPDDPRLIGKISAKREEFAEEHVTEEAEQADLDKYAEEIAEAEFYTRQGLTQEALDIYKRLLSLFPDNEEIQEKILAIQGAVEEAPTVSSEIGSAAGAEAPVEGITPHEPETMEAAAEKAEPQFKSDVLEIFEEFKKGLESEVEAEDYETHYSLGMAYKEMELIDDAIKEFQTARKNPKHFIQSMSMLGICYMEKGMFPLAIDAFKKALDSIDTREESYWGTKYDIATAYEKNGNIDEAFEIFSEIYGWDSKFRRVDEKINLLKNMMPGGEGTAKQK